VDGRIDVRSDPHIARNCGWLSTLNGTVPLHLRVQTMLSEIDSH
jgi:hypothetical protein